MGCCVPLNHDQARLCQLWENKSFLVWELKRLGLCQMKFSLLSHKFLNAVYSRKTDTPLTSTFRSDKGLRYFSCNKSYKKMILIQRRNLPTSVLSQCPWLIKSSKQSRSIRKQLDLNGKNHSPLPPTLSSRAWTYFPKVQSLLGNRK